ncbi:type II secretion system F family protein [Streptomonospora salina]|uniref:Flp pilus assembly protein TadB n=1 Tax=Streptomonospora salina TaxID=104205 RepID=A0A841EGE2_9ACTN|nr:type II secretion system F family protein [Streptomonospora salina]MBB6000103.1 Flp pilus assembly protein TadB [Streptomonospora salina]
MLGLLMAGAVIGTGALVLAWGLRRPSLAERLHTTSASAPGATGPSRPAGASEPALVRWGRHGAPLLAALGLPTRRIRRDLAATEREIQQYLAEKAVAAVAAVAAPLILGTALTALGTGLPPVAVVLGGLCCGLACWMAPDAAVRANAATRRAELAAATSVLADLVVIALAGGAGVTGALSRAAAASPTRAFVRIRLALHSAALGRVPAWRALGELAETTGVQELGEIAASLRIAGTDGARVRASLAAKAAALRARESAAAEARAQAATERMSLPVMLLIAGFLLLIGYPALAAVAGGFTPT